MKDAALINKIKKLRWVWFWSGNWPLLDAWFERDLAFEKEFTRIVGACPRVIVDIFQNGVITAYHCQEEYDRLERHFMKRWLADPRFILRSFREYKQKTNQDIAALKKISSLLYARLTDLELARIFIQARQHFVFNGTFDHYAWYIEKFFVPKLESILKSALEKLGLRRRLPEHAATLVTPAKPTKVYEERRALFKIVNNIRGNKRLIRFVRSGQLPPDLASHLTDHLKEYCWLPVLVNNPPTRLNDLWREVRLLVRNQAAFKIESRRLGDNFDRKIVKQKKRIIDQLKPDKRTRVLIKTLEETAYIRTEDNAVMSQSSYLVIPLYQEIAKRLGVTYGELKELTPDEVVNFLFRHQKVPRSLINERRRITCLIACYGARKVFTGRKAIWVKEIVAKQIKGAPAQGTVMSGTPASLGKVIAKARVALSSKSASQLRPGEILVAPATSADFVPAMRKAGAIITELGGLTSHAAVVAREFKIPCLVSVTNVTRYLKTGDRVEVNANHGWVRKL